jgi:hypothetical protein
MWRYRRVNNIPFVELKAGQRTPPWHGARKFRITASNYTKAIKGDLSDFATQEQTINRILGLGEPIKINENMQLGIDNEDPLRNWYSKVSNSKIVEPSLCIGLSWYDFPMEWNNGKLLSEVYPSQLNDPLHPNWFIGGSPDGEIYYPNGEEANLEIKFTRRLYWPLQKRWFDTKNKDYSVSCRHYEYNYKNLNFAFQEDVKNYTKHKKGAVDFYPHIYMSHFMQMQGCMSILGRNKCVYLVGTPKEKYVETVNFDTRFWKYYLYPNLVEAVETKIKPRMSLEQKKDFSNKVKDIIKIIPKDCDHGVVKNPEVVYKF